VRTSVALSVLFLLCVAPPWGAKPARAENAAFSNGSKAFASGDYLKALAYFEEAKNAGVEGPAIHYNLGVCHYRLQSYSQAEAEFRLVADRYPKMRALAEYNIGLVLLAEDRAAEARRQFELARQTSTDEKITRLAEAMLRRTGPSSVPLETSPRWVSGVDLNVGHDDNVALLDDASLPAGQSTDSAFTELLAVVSGPLKSGPGLRFDGSLYAVNYADAGEFDQTAARVGGAYRWTTGAWRMEAEAHFTDSTLDGDAFEHRLGAGISLKRPLSPATTLGLSLVHEAVDSGNSRFAFLEGSREQLGVSWDRYGANGRLTLGYRYESNDRSSPTVSPTRNGASLRYRYTMSPVWMADLSFAFRKSVFDDANTPRDEERTDVSVGLRRRFSRTWHLNGTYLWSDNRSNVTAFTYTRQRLSLGVSKDF
jgi:tetratricopeptide (TPR) repeat protein